MNVIIIGSKGFIGNNLFNYFQIKGYNVSGADVMVDYADTEHYFLIDASNSDYNDVFQHSKFDVCVNCSGAASVPESLMNPIRDYYLNTTNVFRILEAIRKHQPKCRFVNLSSAAVYGNPQVLPVNELLEPNPLSPYGFHKLQAEQICKEYWGFFGIPTCSLRIFSVYGPGLKKQIFWDLFRKAKSGIPFSLYGTGNESRDFIYILDLVKAIELVIKFSNFEADIVNVANGKEIKIEDAVSTFFSFFKPEIKYSFSGEIRKGDPVNWRADISKLINYGYHPSVDIITGLSSYYEWIEMNNLD